MSSGPSATHLQPIYLSAYQGKVPHTSTSMRSMPTMRSLGRLEAQAGIGHGVAGSCCAFRATSSWDY